ncbi:TRAP transporter substrate-binding protein [Pokkaliibacter sp. CJK22405]|uniref:TRAP transporter substrate-binding protein n=1 Tax=Pokkaliibacter sp. CJK22405 TaxID=3384615 RepID=UPI00398507C2
MCRLTAVRHALNKALRPAVLGASLVAGLSLAGASQAAETWDMPMAYPASNYHSETGAAFAKEVNEKAGDEINIVTHPNGSLFGGGEIFNAVRRGLAPAGERIISALGNEDPLFEIDAIPFLATSFDDAWNLYQASKPALEKLMDKKGLKLLYTVPWPPQGLYTKKQLTSLDDMKGSKFRAYNPITTKLAELIGAVPTKVEAAEVSQAFATGVADSMITSASTGYDTKAWEFSSYFYDVQAWVPKNMVFVNKKAFEALSPETQKVMMEAAAHAEKAGWDKARELTAWYKDQLQTNGLKVETPPAAITEGFKKVGDELLQDWLKKSGDEGKAVIDAYRAM